MAATAVEHARQEWNEGHRRLEVEARDPGRAEELYHQLDVVLAELRRRVGETFTLAQLAQAYAGSEDWAREAVAAEAPGPGWARHLTLVNDAAFHLYARGATDYRP